MYVKCAKAGYIYCMKGFTMLLCEDREPQFSDREELIEEKLFEAKRKFCWMQN